MQPFTDPNIQKDYHVWERDAQRRPWRHSFSISLACKYVFSIASSMKQMEEARI